MDAMQIDDEIFVAGHRGLLGSAVVRALSRHGYKNLLLRSRTELDLLAQPATFTFFERHKPKFVFLCAAKVGGIQANVQGIGQFMYENLQIQNNVIEAARCAQVKKLVFVGSTCIYPVNAANPIREESLLQGPIEPTNEGYGLAKVAGVRLCQFYRRQYGCDFVSAIPCNLFGLNDHFDPNNSHVLQALIRKVHLARTKGEKVIELWGSGSPRREFLFADDCAEALVTIMNRYDEELPINVGTGVDHSIVELAQLVAEGLDYQVEFVFDRTKPDGIARKLSDSSRMFNLGWRPATTLVQGIRLAYQDFLSRSVQSI